MATAEAAPNRAVRYINPKVLGDDILFAQQYLRIVPREGGMFIPLIPNKAQRYIYDQMKRYGTRVVILKARQLGCSTWMLARAFRRVVTEIGITALTMTHEPKSSTQLFNTIRNFYDFLPFAPKLKYDNVHQMSFRDLKSTIGVGTSGSRSFGRAYTVHVLHVSELAFWKFPEQTLESLANSVPPGPRADILIESTPNGAAGLFYELCMRAMKGEGPYHFIFLPWWLEPSYAVPLEAGEQFDLSTDESILVEKYGLTLEQIKWRRLKQAEYRTWGREEFFIQDFPEDPYSCFVTSSKCYFNAIRLRELLSKLPDPIDEFDGWRVWERYDPRYRYVMGADVGLGGESGDYSAAVVRCVETGARVATYLGHITPLQFAVKLAQMGKEYDAVIAVERNGPGFAVIEKLLELGYSKIYRGELGLGWATTQATRMTMLEALRAEVAAGEAAFNDERLLGQMLNFYMKPGLNPRPEARQGQHDDLVMADAIALSVAGCDPGGPVII